MADKIIGLGEVLWDMLPTGKALGGAPANFAYHATRLGGSGVAVSAVGNDPLGDEIVALLTDKGLAAHIERVAYPTGTVAVTLDERGVPSYEICEGVAWDNIPYTAAMHSLAEEAAAVCFGSLAQRSEVSAATIERFLAALPDGCLKIFDINLRQHYYSQEIIEKSLQIADILKINDEEMDIVAPMLGVEGDDTARCRALLDRYNLQAVVLTRGAKGSLVVSATEADERGVVDVEVVDTVGAGDAFTAGFVVAWLRGDSLSEAHKLATESSAYACTLKGAM